MVLFRGLKCPRLPEPDFNALHSGRCNEEVQFYAFDVLALDGEDLRVLP
jgi:ATP-dependent DNA ligase